MKRMSTIATYSKEKNRIYVKGASEVVLELCTSYVSDNGVISALGETQIEELKNIILKMASKGFQLELSPYNRT